MGKRIVELQSKTQKSFYGKAMVHYDEGSASLYSYGTFIAKVVDGSVVEFSKDENHYTRTTMKHLNDFLEQQGLNRTNLAEVRLSIENGEMIHESRPT